MNLQEADAAALQYLQGNENQPVEQPVTPESTPTQQQTPAASASPSVATLADDALVELEVNGQKITKPWKQARAEMMLHADYTRKRQAEAEEVKQARELAQKIQRRDEAYNALLADPRNILALYHAVTGQTAPGQQDVPARQADELVTVEDIQRTRQELLNETDQIQEFQDQIFIEDIQRTTSSTINTLLEEKKEIAQFYGEDAAGILRKMARAKQPADAAELKAALAEAADHLSKRIKQQIDEIKKESAIKQTELTRQGIEPPGGGGLPAAPKTYGEGRQVNWGDIDRDAQAYLESRLNR
jgi:hypothetical protein